MAAGCETQNFSTLHRECGCQCKYRKLLCHADDFKRGARRLRPHALLACNFQPTSDQCVFSSLGKLLCTVPYPITLTNVCLPLVFNASIYEIIRAPPSHFLYIWTTTFSAPDFCVFQCFGFCQPCEGLVLMQLHDLTTGRLIFSLVWHVHVPDLSGLLFPYCILSMSFHFFISFLSCQSF